MKVTELLTEGLGDGRDKLLGVIFDAGGKEVKAHLDVYRFGKSGVEVRMSPNSLRRNGVEVKDKWLISVLNNNKVVGSAIQTAAKLKSTLARALKDQSV